MKTKFAYFKFKYKTNWEPAGVDVVPIKELPESQPMCACCGAQLITDSKNVPLVNNLGIQLIDGFVFNEGDTDKDSVAHVKTRAGDVTVYVLKAKK